MKRLLLLRHAKAVPAAVDDHARALSPKGCGDAAAVGRAILDRGWRPDLALVSDARRTRETFAHLGFGAAVAAREDGSLYEATPAAILAAIAQAPPAARTVLVVGHNPGIAQTARQLTGGGDDADLARLRGSFPTATLAVLLFDEDDWGRLPEGEGQLDALLWTDTHPSD